MAWRSKGGKLVALFALCPVAIATAAAAESPLRAERWSEDWSDVSGVRFKNMDVGHGLRLTFGADARWKSQMLDAPHLGIDGEPSDGWILLRALAHADLHIGKTARVFAQLGVHDALDHDSRSPSDDGRLDLNLAFLDLNGEWGAARATLRLGRQELALGSPRYVTLRDNTNLRQRHDLARLIVTDGPWRADFFSGRPTQDRVGVFDDRADPDQEFFGARLQRRFGDITADIEYFDLSRDDFRMAGVTANDRRQSVGVRVAGRVGDYDIDTEVLSQSGSFGAQDVRAIGGAIDIGRTFPDANLAPRIAARLTYGSGDSDPLDNKQETFAPPFPRGAWFGQTGLSSFSNSVEAAAFLDLTPNEDVSLEFKLGGLWRADTNDFVYAGTNTALPGTRGGGAFASVTPSAQVVWRANENVTLSAYASAVFPSHDLRDDGADTVNYVQTTIAYRF